MPRPRSLIRERNRVYHLEPAGDDPGYHRERPYVLGLTDPVNHLLALTDPDRSHERPDELILQYGEFAVNPTTTGLTDEGHLLNEAPVLAAIGRWRKAGVPEDFLAAARRGQEGILDHRLAPYLERVRIEDEHTAWVPSLVEFGAWALHRAIVRGSGYTVTKCANCGLPFLASDRARYCTRFAPGSGQSCQDVAKVRDHRERRRAAKKGGKDGDR
jgi:hypothetical protein